MPPDTDARTLLSRHRRRSWSAVIIGIGGLAVLAFAYWYTWEPAPAVRVRWRDGLHEQQQEALERKYLLANRQGPHPDAPTSFGYDLLDTSRRNIEALVTDPDVADTNDIDDETFHVRLSAADGERDTWIANRIPVLRRTSMRAALIMVLGATALVGLRGLAR